MTDSDTRESKLVLAFLAECTTHDRTTEESGRVYDAFRDWAQANRPGVALPNHKKFTELLVGLGYEIVEKEVVVKTIHDLKLNS